VLRALVFDFNGILVDDEPIHLRLFQRVLREEGIELSKEDYYREYLGFDDRGAFSAIFEHAGRPLDPAAASRLIVRKASYYQEVVRRDGYPFFAGAVELVREAAAGGMMLGLVSGALREEIDQALRQAGLRDAIKVVVAAEDVALGKPDPEGYRRVLEELNARPPLPQRLLHPHEVLAIEDSPAGLEAAAGAGLVTLGVAHSYPAAELRMADVVVERLSGLTLASLQGLYAAVSRA